MQRFGLEDKVINDIVNILKKYEEVESAKIFGSRAKGNYRKASDIDIALFGENITFSINAKIFYEIDDLYLPYKIDLINFNSISPENTIRDNILKEGVEFYVKQSGWKLLNIQKSIFKIKRIYKTDNGSEKDRNLISHTYKENIAIEIHERIVNKHINTLSKFIEKFDNKII